MIGGALGSAHATPHEECVHATPAAPATRYAPTEVGVAAAVTAAAPAPGGCSSAAASAAAAAARLSRSSLALAWDGGNCARE
jgi:hypothetical protein